MFSEFRDIITSSSVSTMVNYWWFPKKYLIGCSSKEVSGWNFELPQFTFGTTPDEYVLDDIESGLLRLLCQNARLSFTELAERLNTTPAIVKYRLQKLEKSGLLAGYRIDVDRSKLGMTLFKVQLHPKTFSTEDQQAFHDYCRKHPQISEYVQQLGDCKIEFIVEALDYAQFNELIDSMRSEFSHYIQNLEYMMVKQDYFHRTPSNSFIDRACMPKTEKRLGGEPRKIAA